MDFTEEWLPSLDIPPSKHSFEPRSTMMALQAVRIRELWAGVPNKGSANAASISWR